MLRESFSGRIIKQLAIGIIVILSTLLYIFGIEILGHLLGRVLDRLLEDDD